MCKVVLHPFPVQSFSSMMGSDPRYDMDYDEDTAFTREYNDKASSLEVTPGCVVTVYSDINYSGRSAQFDSSVTDLRIYNFENEISSLKLCSKGEDGCTFTPTPRSYPLIRTGLWSYDVLYQKGNRNYQHYNDRIYSWYGVYHMIYQDDGNLVIYKEEKAMWSTKTHGRGSGVVKMQADGNLVLYLDNGAAIWHTSTHGNPGAYAELTGDGVLLIKRFNKVLWSSDD